MLAGCSAPQETEVPELPTPTDTVRVPAAYRLGGERSLELWGDLGGIDFFADGRAVAADSYSHRILFFDDTGAVADSLGRMGDGPGDLTGAAGVNVLGNGRLAVLSHDGARVTVFSNGGPETFRTNTAFTTRPWQGVITDGPTVIMSEYDRATGYRLWRIPTDGGQPSSVERTHHDPHLISYMQDGVEHQIASPFSRETYWAVGPQGEFAYLSADSSRITVGTFDEGVTDEFAIPDAWDPVPQDRAAFHWRMGIVRGGLDLPYSETPLPKISSLYIDDSGRLWIGRTPRYSSMYGNEYHAVVVDLETMASTAVVLPPFAHLGWGEFFVSGDRAAARRHDSLYRDEAIVLDLSGLRAIGPP